jgi:pimeloyl-ACP methyl ester carboxylesterase
VPKLLPATSPPAAPWKAREADEDYGVTAQPDWRQVDWARSLHRVDVDGTSINYVDIGEGDDTPVLLVHGLAGQWQNWLENIPRISQERRVLALDLPGHGQSEDTPGETSIQGYARTVDGFLEALGVKRAHVVGNSMGGFVASELAVQFPHRVDRLVLVSAAGISNTSYYRAPAMTLGRIAQALTTATAARHRALAGRPITRHMALALVARHPSRLKPDLAWEGLMKGAGKPSFRDALRANLEYDFRDRVSEIEVPTLVVWGAEDSVISVHDAGEFERLIGDARKVVMEDTGHVPMLERPTAFNDLLLEFLAEAGAAEDKEPVEGESEHV